MAEVVDWAAIEVVVAPPSGEAAAVLPVADMDVAGDGRATTAAEFAEPRGHDNHVAASAAIPMMAIAATTTIAAFCDCCTGCAGAEGATGPRLVVPSLVAGVGDNGADAAGAAATPLGSVASGSASG